MTCFVCGDDTSPPETFNKGAPLDDSYIIYVTEEDEFEFCSVGCLDSFIPEENK